MITRYPRFPATQSFFLFGPRLCGKTTWIKFHLKLGGQKSWAISLNLAKYKNRYEQDLNVFREEALFQINTNGVTQIYVDEVQKLPQMLDEIHELMEEYPSCQFILTGSSARKLKRGNANLLAARAVQRFLFPFIYSEIKDTFILEDVLQFGSIPGIYGKERPTRRELLITYCETYLKEEIQAEGIARNLSAFKRFLDLSSFHSAQILNYSNIGREAGISTRTIQGYFEVLEDTLIGFKILPWNESFRKRLGSHPKFYFFDNGVQCALMNRLLDPLDPALKGKLFEQWMIQQIKAMIEYEKSPYQLYFWYTQQGEEVDLLLVRDGIITHGIEFKTSPRLYESDFKGLLGFQQEYPAVELFLVCLNQEDRKTNSNVTIMNWKNFLEKFLPIILKC